MQRIMNKVVSKTHTLDRGGATVYWTKSRSKQSILILSGKCLDGESACKLLGSLKKKNETKLSDSCEKFQESSWRKFQLE